MAIFPIISNTTLGLRSVDPGLLALFRLCRASRWQELTRLRIPSALPLFFGGLRIASGLALIGLISGQVDVLIMTVAACHQQVKAGKVRALATVAPDRASQLPDVPTLKELGYENFIVRWTSQGSDDECPSPQRGASALCS